MSTFLTAIFFIVLLLVSCSKKWGKKTDNALLKAGAFFQIAGLPRLFFEVFLSLAIIIWACFTITLILQAPFNWRVLFAFPMLVIFIIAAIGRCWNFLRLRWRKEAP